MANHSLSDKEAEKILTNGYIEYLHGRVMKIDLSGDFINTWLYNRDNGSKTAEMIIDELRKK